MAIHFRRRDFIVALSGVAAAWPLAARAQQVGRAYRIGLLFSTSPVSEMAGPEPIHPSARLFVHTLRDLGYVEGKNLVLERRSAEGRFERFPEIIRELLSLNVDVIMTTTNPMTRAAKQVTQTVPIVMIGANAVEEGLIQSLARPGGNVTGISAITSEMLPKWVQFLKELLPGLSRVAYLQSKAEMVAGWEQSTETAARELGVKILLAEYTPPSYADAFAFILREHVDALVVPANASNFANRHLIVRFAAENRLPTIYGFREFVAAGGLIGYGVDYADAYRRAAAYVDKILKGAKPADLPVEQPTKFELVIHLKTAKALGLTIPTTLLATADEVIE
jgi:putative ABC transport system substrate-binding protein